jgi:serine/threonine-protein kinase 11
MTFLSFGKIINPYKIHHDKMLNDYLLLTKLNQDSLSKIYLAKDSDTSENVAIKMIHLRSKKKTSPINDVIREITIFSQINHSNIIKLKEILFSEEKRMIYIVMEFATFGSLDRILEAKRKIAECLAATIFKQVIQAIAYLHRNNIAHHDIKQINILLTKNGTAKLSDFGLSSSFESACNLSGSPAYQAPEIFDDHSDDLNQFDASKIDIWSLGVSLFESVFGFLPFKGGNAFQIASSIQRNPISIPDGCSSVLRNLLKKMLVVNPLKRISIEQLLEHPFFQLYKDFAFDSFEPIFIPDIKLTQDIVHNSGSILENDNLTKLIPFLPRTLS